ncbi:hypothetical protein T01_10715 [Trichinella spiralis]|uniref:Uncharacterized protein n=1 Tax=Trichinella spiralis TaxID=6334 RepID=A0A0V1BJ03_TRISP|nr:hypothetical protein T01_10715 [Trichinella spiralis]
MMANKQLRKLTTPSAARLLLYSYVQRNFDYCSVHVSTVISHVSQQFRFLVFFIVTQWVVSVQWNYFFELEYLSLMVVQVSLNGLKRCTKIYVRSYSCVTLSWLNGVTQYCSRNMCGFAYRRTYIVNIVDLRWFSDTSHKSGSACCHQCVWNGLHHQLRARSYSCVSLGWLNCVTQYLSRNLCGFAYHRSMI